VIPIVPPRNEYANAVTAMRLTAAPNGRHFEQGSNMLVAASIPRIATAIVCFIASRSAPGSINATLLHVAMKPA
jgi:hypothetical protein